VGEPPVLTRFGILGDVHCEDERLARALEVLRGRDVDAILAVGDIVDGYGDVERTVALLDAHDVIAVRGNHERWFITGQMRNLDDSTTTLSGDAWAWVESLPTTRELETSAGKLLLCHGVGEDDMLVLRPDTRGYGLQAALTPIRGRDDLSFVVGGHTHIRMVRVLGTGLTFINPGTLHRNWEAGFGLVDLETREVTFWDFVDDEPRASERIPL
jgi:putative phosphoesterase